MLDFVKDRPISQEDRARYIPVCFSTSTLGVMACGGGGGGGGGGGSVSLALKRHSCSNFCLLSEKHSWLPRMRGLK